MTCPSPGSEKYDLLVDWSKRLANELPLLRKLFQEVQAKQILEIACSSGMHAIALAEEGYSVTGTDIDEGMIEIAKERAEEQEHKIEFVVGDFNDPNLELKGNFDAIFSLGNAIPLIAKHSSYDEVFARVFSLLKPGGVFFAHGLNFEKQRSGWSKPRIVKTEEFEHFFVRRFEAKPEEYQIEIMHMFRPTDKPGDWLLESDWSLLKRVNREQLRSSLLSQGFDDIRFLGNYQGEQWTLESIDTLIVAKRSE